MADPISQMMTDKSGTIFPQPEYFWLYLSVYFPVTASFALLNVLFQFVIPKLFPSKYEKNKSDVEKKYFTGLFVSITHHSIISFYVIWIYCNSQCKDAYPFIWFYDEVCQLEFDPNFIYAGMITAAYLTYDYIYQKFWVADKSKAAKAMLLHHIIGGGGILLGLSSGYVAPGVCSITLLSEFCSIFLNIREMQTDKFSLHPLAVINFVMFLLTYTFLRVFLIPYGLYIYISIAYKYTFEVLPFWRQAALIYGAIQVCLLSFLNVFWYNKILKGILKMFGCIKSKKGKAKVGSESESSNDLMGMEPTELTPQGQSKDLEKDKNQDQNFNRVN